MDIEMLKDLLAAAVSERDEFTQQAQQRLAWLTGRIELLQSLIENGQPGEQTEDKT